MKRKKKQEKQNGKEPLFCGYDYSTRENSHMDMTIEKTRKKLIKFRVTLFPKKEWIWVGI